MAKRLKLKFPRLIASFQSLQICRSRDPSTLPGFHRRRFIGSLQSTKEHWTPCTLPGYWRHLQHQNRNHFINAGYSSAAAPDHHHFRRGRRKLKAPASMIPKLVARITFRTTNLRIREPKEKRTKRKSIRAFLSETVADVAT